MSTQPDPADHERRPRRAPAAATLVVRLGDLSVAEASATAIAWLGLSRDRLVGRSLMLSCPELGQSLTVAIAAGLEATPRPLPVTLANPEGSRLRVSAQRQASDAVVELHADEVAPASAPSPGTDLRQELLRARDAIAGLRAHAEAGVTHASELHPLHHWMWQAEVALTRLLEQDDDLEALAASRGQGTRQEDRL